MYLDKMTLLAEIVDHLDFVVKSLNHEGTTAEDLKGHAETIKQLVEEARKKLNRLFEKRIWEELAAPEQELLGYVRQFLEELEREFGENIPSHNEHRVLSYLEYARRLHTKLEKSKRVQRKALHIEKKL